MLPTSWTVIHFCTPWAACIACSTPPWLPFLLPHLPFCSPVYPCVLVSTSTIHTPPHAPPHAAHAPISSHCSESCHLLLTSSRSTLMPPTVFRNEPEWLTEEVPCACIASLLLEKSLENDRFSL